jgi:chitinase
MNTKHRSKLKTTLLSGVALAAASLSAHAGTEVAPYFYTWAFGGSGYAANSLAQAQAAGVNAVTLAFGTSNGSCTLQGFNFSSSTKADVQSFIANGGRVILSFGGADGPFLEDDCSTSQLYNIINNLVSTYKIYYLDFDNGTGAQRFSISVADSSDPTAMEIVNEDSGKCIDDTNWSTADRNPLQQWACTGATNQSFRFYPIGSTTAVSVK